MTSEPQDAATAGPDTADSTGLVRLPQSAARLQQRPVIETIDEKTLQLIASQVAPGCTRGEVGHFLELCAHYDLDPFAREAWCAKGRGENARLLIMVGRDGLRKIAKRQGLEILGDVVRADDTYSVEFIDSAASAHPGEWDANGHAPFHRITHTRNGMGDTRGVITGAWCRVTDPTRREVGFFEAPVGEYKPKDARKLQYSPWGSQESVMILAAAERQALRQATPLGGLLAEGEEARVGEIEARVVEQAAVQELSDQEVDELSGAITAAGWTDEQTRMELVAAGAEDVSDIAAAVRVLSRSQAIELISRFGRDEGEILDAEPVEDDEPLTIASDESEEAGL